MNASMHRAPAPRGRRPLPLGMYPGFRIFWDAGRQGYYATETVLGRLLRQRTGCFDSGTPETSLRLLLAWLDQCAEAHQRLQARRGAGCGAGCAEGGAA